MKNFRCLLVVVLASLCSTFSALAHSDRAPNIVLLIGDDHGYEDFKFMGDPDVITPSMDAIAEGGVAFTQAHVSSSYCRPSLRTLITGLHPIQYALRHGPMLESRIKKSKEYASLSDNEKMLWQTMTSGTLLKEFETLPKMLARKGYSSWQGGKWWENSYENGYFDEGMTKGWDIESVKGKNSFLEMMGGDGTELGRTTMEPLFDFITRKKDQPFFIWYGPQLPHTPFDAPYKYRKYYESKHISESAKDYYANITWWDDGVGQLMDHIESLGLLEDTLFIYVSDNGWEQEPDVEYKRDHPDFALFPDYATGGLKGKGELYDLSFRTAMLFYWKNNLKSSFNESSLVTAMDIVPTILDIVGLKAPRELPGYSLKGLLEGRQIEERDEIIGYNDRARDTNVDELMQGLGNMMGPEHTGFYLRTNRWHYITRNNGIRELYDITIDPMAKNNVVESHADLIPDFDKKIKAWKKKMGLGEEWLRIDL